MKGMQKIKRGSGFLGVLTYATVRETTTKWDGAVIGGNMLGNTAAELSAEFGLSRRIRPDIERPVWHNSLRLPQGDKASLDKWEVMADEYMQRMGFSSHHQRAYILHDPEGMQGQHIHIVASRISLSGEIYLGQNENLKSTKIISQLEKDFDLTITKGVDYSSQGKIVMPAVAAPSKTEMDIAIKRGERSERIRIKEIIDAVILDGNISASDFCDRLILAGVRVLPNISEATGGLSGFSFGLVNGVLNFSGSKIGSAYKLHGLEIRGMGYVKERDFQHLAAVAREFRECSGIRETTRIATAGFSDVSRGADKRAGGGNEGRSFAESKASLGESKGTDSSNFHNGQPVGRECSEAFRANPFAREVDIRSTDKAAEASETFRARADQGVHNEPKSNDLGVSDSRSVMFDDGFFDFSIINKDNTLRRVKSRIEYRGTLVGNYFLTVVGAVNLVFRSACDELLKLYNEGFCAEESGLAKDPAPDFLNLSSVPNKSKAWDFCGSDDNFCGERSEVINDDFEKNKYTKGKSLAGMSYYI